MLQVARGGVQAENFGTFVIDKVTAEAIRRAWNEGGELSAVFELRRHFPLIADNTNARLCVRTIVGWAPKSSPKQDQS